MAINLSVTFSHPAAIATQISYARIDNTANPVFTTLVPNLSGLSGTFTIATNIPDGQYQINALPIYADGRACQPTITLTPPCPGLTSISAVIQSGVIVVTYLAPSSAPKVRITINFPNGGSFTANYVNDGNPISIGLPVGVYGNYTVSGQSVCDESSGFYSPPSSSVTVNYSQSISGSYHLGNSIAGACGASVTTLYTNGSPVPGSILYTDAALTNAITGFIYVLYAGIVYNLNSTTGTLGSNTGQSCTNNATLTLTFVNASGGSLLNFQATLSSVIDANVNITRMFADGFSSTDCSGSAVSSAQKNSSMIIAAGSTAVGSTPDTTSGTWASAIRSKVYNVIVNGAPILNGSIVVVGSFNVTMIVQSCS